MGLLMLKLRVLGGSSHFELVFVGGECSSVVKSFHVQHLIPIVYHELYQSSRAFTELLLMNGTSLHFNLQNMAKDWVVQFMYYKSAVARFNEGIGCSMKCAWGEYYHSQMY